MSDNAFCIRKKIICILDRTNTDCICIHCCVIKNLLCLCCCLSYDLICLSICLLHDLMLTDKLCCLNLCFLDHCICFCLCISKNRISVRNNLLITFDLIRCLHTKFAKQLIQMLLIYNNLCCRQRLKLTISVYIFFNFFNDLFNTAAHCYTLLFSFIFSLSAISTASGTNCDTSPPKAAISRTVVELK